VTRYRWVASQGAAGFPVSLACSVAEVSTSAYYDWAARVSAGPSDAELDEAYLINDIIDIHAGSDSTYGSPRVTRHLRRWGYCINHKRTERLMRDHNIVGITERRRVRTTVPAEGVAPLPDLVERRFAPGAPDVAWAGDITYVPTDEGWLYVASTLDLGSRRLVGWAMDDTMPTSLVADALIMAAATRGGEVRGVIFHSDRGSQYMSARFAELCDGLGIRRSAGRVATCFDNSVAEAFWSSLKRELVHRYRFATRAQAKAAITAWIRRYNNVRLHSSLDYVPAIEWELNYRLTQLQAAQPCVRLAGGSSISQLYGRDESPGRERANWSGPASSLGPAPLASPEGRRRFAEGRGVMAPGEH
jgi:putative transposase